MLGAMPRFTVMLVLVVLLASPASSGKPPPAAPKKADKAALCYSLGRTYGYAYWALNDTWRARTVEFERFCTLGPRKVGEPPPPSEAEVTQLLADLTGFARTLDERPYVDYQQLERNIRPMLDAEGELLKQMQK